jgi:hypothetical protein
MLAGLIDQAIQYKKKPTANKPVLMGNKIAQYEKEAAQREQKALSNRIHSIAWDVKSREVESIEFEEVI